MGSKKKGNKIPARFVLPLNIEPGNVTRPTSGMPKYLQIFGNVESGNDRGLIDIKVISPNGKIIPYNPTMYVATGGVGGANKAKYGWVYPVTIGSALGNYGITLTMRDPGKDKISGNFVVKSS